MTVETENLTGIVATDEGQPLVVREFFFSSTRESAEETVDGDKKIIWKDILREGEFPMTPGPNGAQNKPFKVVVNGKSSSRDRTISMADLIDAHQDKAFDHVTIPTSHNDTLLENTGFVPNGQESKLRVVKRDGTHYLQAGLGFTEPEIAGKVRRGTIPNVSSGILFDFTKKATKKTYRAALKHVCLTLTPFIDKLTPFKAVFASDEEITVEPEIESYQFADGDNSSNEEVVVGGGGNAEIVWDERNGFDHIREQVSEALNPRPDNSSGGEIAAPAPVERAYYSVRDVSKDDNALVAEHFRGRMTRFVIPYTHKEDGTVEISPQTRWTEAREAMIAASDEETSPPIYASDQLARINEAIGQQLGPHARAFQATDLTLDGRAKVRSSTDGATWLVGFADVHGQVIIDASDQWQGIEADDPSQKPETKTDAKQQASAPSVVALSDNNKGKSTEERLSAARQRRRQLLSSTSR